tara:strand:+ start:1448 stop:2641 length:1194 start_codon:yes stop_codon:yes gene_type:complete
MERILYIYLLLIIVLVLIIGYYSKFEKNNNVIKNENENFKPTNNLNNFTNEYINNKFNSEPDYYTENISQFGYDRLYNKLQMINNEKIELEGPLNNEKYIVSTIDDKLRRDLDNITKYVLLILNQDNYYDFSKTNYGNVEIFFNKNNDSNYIYELFLWDKKNYFEIKLLIDIIKIPKKSYIHNFGIKDKKYIFEDFNIGIPSKDQLIPLPLDVIPTENSKLSNEIYKNDPLKPKYFYLNQVKIQNSTLIVDYEKNNFNNNKMNIDEYSFSGITDQTLEFNTFKSNNNPINEKSVTSNKWPVLKEEPKWKGQYPAKTPPQSWDVDGIYYYSNSDKIKAAKNDTYSDMHDSGTIWSPMKMPLQPDSRPTLTTLPRNQGENYWLFDSQGPEGTFFGGGKK